MQRALADPLSLGGEVPRWTPPSTLPPLDEAKKAYEILRAATIPAHLDHVKGCLKFIAFATAHKDSNAEDWRYRVTVYAASLRDIPADIWSTKAKEIALSVEWWPSVSKMAAILMPPAEARRRQLERCRWIVESYGRTQVEQQTPAKVSDEERVAGMVAVYLKHGMDQKAIDAERRLALLQKREPSEWARDGASLPPPTLADFAQSGPLMRKVVEELQAARR